MSGLTRRGFLGVTAALAASFSLPQQALARVLLEPAVPADVPTTLQQTILQRTVAQKNNYRVLTTGAGDPFVVRPDLVDADPSPARVAARRSLAYLGHTSDIHVMDAQTPGWLDPVAAFAFTLLPGVCRPQETLTVHVQSAMVQAVHDVANSPVTGAPMIAVLNTGDSSDRLSNLELRWYIDIFDGKSVQPNSGAPGQYEGPQLWQETTYAYHPEDPSNDPYGAYGFPTIPGMLEAVVNSTVESVGSPAPWYTVYGNHDVTLNGTFATDESFRNLATGSQRAYAFPGLATSLFRGMATDISPATRLLDGLRQQFGNNTGFKTITANTERSILTGVDYMAQHLDSPDLPGPVGHGFTQANVDNKTTYWKADIGPALRVFGLDTCNLVMGADGAVPQSQFDWLQSELEQVQADGKLAIVLSHHNSLTLENEAHNIFAPGEKLIHAPEFIDMLLKFPNLVAWLNGHTHINTIQAHRKPTGAGGFFEITTASCIDYPQQAQTVELVDNKDGTMSIFCVTLDHASPASWTQGDFSQIGLASLSRELSSNDWSADPLLRRGSPLDRNVELLLLAPFDLSTITDAALETEFATRKAQLAASAGGA
ncbi:MAG: family metallophosphoesterase [Actinomycetota bacterium]|nr:family metallophosphoesterase [Actinomycetota bacterium]